LFVILTECARALDRAEPRMETAADLGYWPPRSARDLLVFDESMRRFFASRVNPDSPEGERLEQIVAAILRPEGLGFAYEAEGTYDAREAFRRRRGNCQGFSFLVVAAARAYGLRARFQDFGSYQRWNRFDRYVASVRHTNVRVNAGLEDYVVDLRPEVGRPSFASSRYVVSDQRAFAHFYSTAGFFRLVQQDGAGARQLMQWAAELDPGSAIVWSNLGNLQSQNGDLAEARECFEKSLRLDARSEESLVGLVRVLQRLGGEEELKLAAGYERRVRAYQERNPYYAFALAGQAQLRGDGEEAERRLRRAIHLKGDEPLFHEELIGLLHQAGREKDAQRAEAKLARLRERIAKVGTLIIP